MDARSFSCRMLMFFLFTGVVAGCTARQGGARLFPPDSLPYGEKLQGIAGSDGDTYVLYVHGMGETDASFSRGLVESGTEHLPGASMEIDPYFSDKSCSGACRTIVLDPPVYLRGEGLECDPAGTEDPCVTSRMGELRKATVKNKGHTVHIFSLYWDAVADGLQTHYSYSDLTLIGDAFRPLINRKLKDAVVTKGFSDAALYLGSFGKVMRRGLEQALCHMLREALSKPPASPCLLSELDEKDKEDIAGLSTVFVAKSLGSRYLLDTLLPADQMDVLLALEDFEDDHPAIREIEAKKAVAASLSRVYLLANQLPLLGLGGIRAHSLGSAERRDRVYCRYVLKESEENCETSPVVQGETFSASSKLLYHANVFDLARKAREELSLQERKINVYAFHDPADLLGYKAGHHFTKAAKDNVNFVEIVHRNARQWLWLFADPDAAHAKEDVRPQASRIIWCGATVRGGGKLKPSSCSGDGDALD